MTDADYPEYSPRARQAAECGSESSVVADEPPKRRRDATKTRHDILVAAGYRFGRVGFAGVTLKQIADDVGVTAALVVRYFGSKRALFEEVAKTQNIWFAPLVHQDVKKQLEARVRAIVEYYQDPVARSPGVAVLRSLDLDDGELFREEFERRLLQPWSSEVVGEDAEMRLRLIAGVLVGVGMFSVGALIEPDRAPLTPAEAERLVHYLTEMLTVCVDP